MNEENKKSVSTESKPRKFDKKRPRNNNSSRPKSLLNQNLI